MHAPPRGVRRERRRSFLWGAAVGVLLVLACRLAINETSLADHLVGPLIRSDTAGPADAIVVLGAGVVGHCEPNVNAVRRVMLGVDLWRARRAPIVVFTGGRPRGQPCAVADVMAQLARDLGVPPDRVRTETASHSTHENAVLTAPLLRALGASRVLIVTDRLHMTRAAGVFEHEGFGIERASVPVYATHPDNVSMLWSGMREYVALAVYRYRGWRGTPPGRVSAASATLSAAAAQASSGERAMASVTYPSGPVVILGASYAGGWRPAAIGDITFVNKGVAGQQSWEMLERFDRDVVAERPRAVILWGFINDIHRAPKDRIDPAVARARDSFVQMIARAKDAGIEPIIATEVTIRPLDTWSETIAAWVGWAMGKVSYQEQVNRRVIETNRWLKDLAEREHLLVLDLLPVLSDAQGVRRKAYAKEDGSHITPAGYEALGAYARPLLERHFTR